MNRKVAPYTVPMAALMWVGNLFLAQSLAAPLKLGHTDTIEGACVSSDGTTIATASDDNSVRLWDAGSKKLRQALVGHLDKVYFCCMSPDGLAVATGGLDCTIRFWNATSGKLEKLLADRDAVLSGAFSPDGKVLATGGFDNDVRIWDVETKRLAKTLHGHKDAVFCTPAFSPDGSVLATGANDNQIKLWELTSGEEKLSLNGHDKPIGCLTFSSDGQTLASGAQDNSVKIWDVATGKLLKTLSGHKQKVMWLAFSPDGKKVLSASSDGSVKEWDVTSGNELRTILTNTGPEWEALGGNPGKGLLVSGDRDHVVRTWDLSKGAMSGALLGASPHTGLVDTLAFTSDGKTLASSGRDKTIKLWNITTGELLHTMNNGSVVYSVVFSADNQALVTASEDKKIRVWNVATGKLTRTLSIHTGEVFAVARTAIKNIMVSGGEDAKLKFWDLQSGKVTKTVNAVDYVCSLSPSRNGNLLAYATYAVRGRTVLCDLSTNKNRFVRESDSNVVTRFCNDEKMIVTRDDGNGYADQKLLFFDTATGKKIRELSTGKGESSMLMGNPPEPSMSVRPSNSKIIAVGVKDKVKMYDVVAGKEIGVFPSQGSDTIYSLEFTPDGKTLAVSSGCPSQIQFFDVDNRVQQGLEAETPSELLTKSIAREPSANLYFVRSLAQYKVGKLDECIKDLDECLKLDPTHCAAWIRKAALEAESKKFNEALRDIKEAVKLTPDNVQASIVYARLLLEGPDKKDLDPALSAKIMLTLCERTQWQVPQYISILSQAYEKAGDQSKANEYKDKAAVLLMKALFGALK